MYKEVVCFFKGCSVDLLSFEEIRRSRDLHNYVDRGLQEVPLEAIRGSVGRYKDFSDKFLPRNDHLKERWEHVDVAMRQGQTPPIEVYQVGDTYYVLDGNHRVSVAKQRDLDTIEAYVTEFTTAVEAGEGENFDDALIRVEEAAFLENAGPSNAEAARAMVLTCTGCYQILVDQIEAYRQGYEDSWKRPMSCEEAFAAWYGEVYAPAVGAIRENELLAQFPQRTETDLFIWTWQNNRSLEDMSLDQSSSPSNK